MGFLSVLLGLTQVAQGPSSSLRFFEFTNAQEAVGFFANRNHFAAMLYTLTLLAAAWTGNNGIAFGLEKNRNKFSTASIVSQLASFCILTVLIGAQVVTRSRAGMILTLGALFGAFLLIRQGQRATNGMRPTWLMVGAASLAVVLSMQFSLYRALDRFAIETAPDASHRVRPQHDRSGENLHAFRRRGRLFRSGLRDLRKAAGFDGWKATPTMLTTIFSKSGSKPGPPG